MMLQRFKQWLGKRSASGQLPLSGPPDPKYILPRRDPHPIPSVPQAFGYKIQWLAIRTADTQSVIAALELQEVHPCGWAFGMNHMTDGTFVTQAIQGWTIVMDMSLPEAGGHGRPDQLTPLLCRLSLLLGEVHYYASHRIVGYYSWAQANEGYIRRAFAYAEGEVLLNEGVLTPAEEQLRLTPERCSPNQEEETDEGLPDEEHVIELARRWSLDPLMRYENLEPGLGWSGQRTS